MRYKDWQYVRRLLVVQLGGLQHMVLLGPALRALRAALPGARMTLLAAPDAGGVVAMLPWADDLLTHDAVWRVAGVNLPPNVEQEVDLIEQLDVRQFDAAVVFTGSRQSPYPAAYVCYLSGIPLRIAQSLESGGGLLTNWVRPLPDNVHHIDRNLFLLESSGLPVAGRHPELHLAPGARASAVALLQSFGLPADEPFVVLAPGASDVARRYPVLEYAEICRELVEQTGLPVLVTGTDDDATLAAMIVGRVGDLPVFPAAGRTTLPEFSALVERSALVITNASMVVSVADALRRAVLVLAVGAEPEARWRPRVAPLRILRPTSSCPVCSGVSCRHRRQESPVPATVIVEEAIKLFQFSETWEDAAPLQPPPPAAADQIRFVPREELGRG